MPEINNIWPGANPVTVRASAALPAAGAYDLAPTEIPTANIQNIQFYITYTRNAQSVSGLLLMHFEWSPYSADVGGVQSWFRLPCISCGTVTSKSDTTQSVQRNVVSYGATGAGAENFVYPDGPMILDVTVERLRVACAEGGDTNNPGTAHIVATML